MEILEELKQKLVPVEVNGGRFLQAPVTPELAKKLLRLSGGNRPLSNKTVAKYAAHMHNHTWDEDAPIQFIMFDKDGVLINGHHTLNAVVRSRETVRLYFMFDCTRSPYIDGGRMRSEADRMTMMSGGTRGDSWSYKRDIAVCNVLTRFTDLTLDTENQRWEYIMAHKSGFDFLHTLTSRPGSNGLSTAPIYTAFYLARKAGADERKLSYAWSCLQEGITYNPGDEMIVYLRDWLKARQGSSNTNTYRCQSLYTVSWVLKRWLDDAPFKRNELRVPETLEVWIPGAVKTATVKPAKAPKARKEPSLWKTGISVS